MLINIHVFVLLSVLLSGNMDIIEADKHQRRMNALQQVLNGGADDERHVRSRPYDDSKKEAALTTVLEHFYLPAIKPRTYDNLEDERDAVNRRIDEIDDLLNHQKYGWHNQLRGMDAGDPRLMPALMEMDDKRKELLKEQDALREYYFKVVRPKEDDHREHTEEGANLASTASFLRNYKPMQRYISEHGFRRGRKQKREAEQLSAMMDIYGDFPDMLEKKIEERGWEVRK